MRARTMSGLCWGRRSRRITPRGIREVIGEVGLIPMVDPEVLATAPVEELPAAHAGQFGGAARRQEAVLDQPGQRAQAKVVP